MRAVSERLRWANIVRISNVWLFRHEGRSFLIDTGHALERPALWWSLRGAGKVAAILLTHRHSDHAGNGAWLRERLACPLICSADDAPFLDGRQAPPPLAKGTAPFYQEVLNCVEDRFPARSAVDEVYKEGPWRWGFHAISAPGHTEGSVMLYHEPTRTLFSGDSILVGIPPFRLWKSLRLAYPGFSADVERNWRSVRAFLRSAPPIDALCPGHGPALMEGAQARLARLVEAEP